MHSLVPCFFASNISNGNRPFYISNIFAVRPDSQNFDIKSNDHSDGG